MNTYYARSAGHLACKCHEVRVEPVNAARLENGNWKMESETRSGMAPIYQPHYLSHILHLPLPPSLLFITPSPLPPPPSQHHALTTILTPSTVVAATSLTYDRPPTNSGVLISSAGDRSNFSRAPPDVYLKEGLQELRATLPFDLRHYLHAMEEEVASVQLY